MKNWLLIIPLLTGCGLFSDAAPTADNASVQRAAESLRKEVNGIVAQANTLRPFVEVICDVKGDDSKECVDLNVLWTAATTATDAAQDLIEAYSHVGFGMERVQQAVHDVHAAADKLAAGVVEVVNVMANSAHGTGNDGDSKTAPAEAVQGSAVGTAGSATAPATDP